MVLAIASMTLDGNTKGGIFSLIGLLGSYIALWSMPVFVHLIPQALNNSEFFREDVVFATWLFNWLVYSSLTYVILQWRDNKHQRLK